MKCNLFVVAPDDTCITHTNAIVHLHCPLGQRFSSGITPQNLMCIFGTADVTTVEECVGKVPLKFHTIHFIYVHTVDFSIAEVFN